MKLKKGNNKANLYRYIPAALILGMAFSLLSACQTPQAPREPLNICSVFKQYPHWYWATQESEKRWGVPKAVQMSILFQESSLKAHSKPPRGKLLGFIPWFRPSTAYGYSQALDTTWVDYQNATGRGSAKRYHFADAADFVGWYGANAHRQAGISKASGKHLYLAYHEGIGGYQQKTYVVKPGLVKTAVVVDTRAKQYQRQLDACRDLPQKSWWRRLLGL